MSRDNKAISPRRNNNNNNNNNLTPKTKEDKTEDFEDIGSEYAIEPRPEAKSPAVKSGPNKEASKLRQLNLIRQENITNKFIRDNKNKVLLYYGSVVFCGTDSIKKTEDHRCHFIATYFKPHADPTPYPDTFYNYFLSDIQPSYPQLLDLTNQVITDYQSNSTLDWNFTYAGVPDIDTITLICEFINDNFFSLGFTNNQ